MPTLKLKLREVMQDKGVSQQELQARTGISRSTLSRWMNNYVDAVSLEMLAQVSKALECEPQDLLDYEPDMAQVA